MNIRQGMAVDVVTAQRRRGGGRLTVRLAFEHVAWRVCGVGGPERLGELWVVGYDTEGRRHSIPISNILEIKEVK